MRVRNAFAKILYVLIILAVLAVTAAAVSFYIREELSDDLEERILIGGEMEVYEGQTARLNPSLVDKNGKIVDAVFDYSTDSEVIALDSLQPGIFRAEGYADEPQIIRISERKSGASAEVLVTIVSDQLNDIVEASLEKSEVRYGETMRISVRTIPKNCDFSSYYTVTVLGGKGVKKDVFEVTADRGGISLRAIGLGEGTVLVQFSNPDRGLEFSREFSFEISLSDPSVHGAVLQETGDTLAGASDLASVTGISLDVSSADLSCLAQLPSVRFVSLSSDGVFAPEGTLPSVRYYVRDEALGDYFASPVWSPYTENIYPAAAEGEEACVVFHSEHGEPYSFMTGKQVAISYRPQVQGYTFVGWYTSASGGTPVTSVDTFLHVYAHWTPNRYTITFVAGSGAGTSEKQAEFDAPFYGMPVPERTGYTFSGWYSQENGGGQLYEEGFVYDIADNLTLYAFWTANTYTVTLDYQGGQAKEQIEVTFGSAIGSVLPATAEKAGNRFGGWYTQSGGKGDLFTSDTVYACAQDITLYAKWVAQVTFDYQGNGESPSSADFVYGAEMNGLPVPQRENFTFEGWFTQPGGVGDEYKEGAPFKEGGAVSLYAKWVTQIRFDAAGGTEFPDSQSVVYNAPVGKLPVPKKTDLKFEGWYTSEEYRTKITSETVYTENGGLTLYARWYIPLRFKYEGATGGDGVSERYVLYGDYLGTETLPQPQRTGYSFLGWFEQPEGQGQQFTASTEVKFDEPFTVYAYWGIETYKIVFKTYTEQTFPPVVVTYGKPLSLPAGLTRAQYDFIGWYLSEEEGNGTGEQVPSDGTAGDLGDRRDGSVKDPIPVMLYARWERITAIYYGAGTESDPYRIYYDYQMHDLAQRVNGGNNFAGTYFLLMNDISALGNWTPIGNNNGESYYSETEEAVSRRFAGVFDGGGHTLEGYNVAKETATGVDTYAGLFGYIAAGGTVKNLNVENVAVDGYSERSSGSKGGGHYGAIAGISSGILSDCHVLSGKVQGEALLDTHIGGVVGYIFLTGSVVKNCTNAASVSGVAGRCVSHGGIVGSVNNGVLYGCSNSGSVSGVNKNTGSYANGVRGYVFLGGIAGVSCSVIVNCSNSGPVAEGSWIYGSVGSAGSGSVVGYLHNGSDVSTDATGDDSLLIDKDAVSFTDEDLVGYYSAVIGCTGAGSKIGFLQNDAGNGKVTVAVTSDVTWRALSGNSPAVIDPGYYNEYLSGLSIEDPLFSTGVVRVLYGYVISDPAGAFEANTSPATGHGSGEKVGLTVLLSVSAAAGAAGIAVLLAGCLKKKKK